MSSAPAEGDAFISGGGSARKPAKSKCAAFMEFVYDSSTVQITVFYIIFYLCLVGFWAGCLAVFLQTISYEEPCWYGKGTIIGVNPGMGYQPWLKDEPDSTLIRFKQGNKKSYQKYVDQLDDYVAKYENVTDTRLCSKDESNAEDNDKACRFDVKPLKRACGEDWGYKNGQPCVIITLNRLIRWTPVKYPKNSAPNELKNRANSGDIAIYCEGEYAADQENMGELQYIPKEGLDRKYYPYKVMTNYHQPIAIVKFRTPPVGIAIEVECKAYAYNIVHDRSDRQGMVHFELLVEPEDGDDGEEEEKK